MKTKILLSLIIGLIIGSCAPKKPVETTVLGMWTDYALIPNKLNGKVKEVKELNYWAVEKDGKMTKGELMSSKDLDSVGSTLNLKANFNEQGMITRYEILDKENVLQTRIATIDNGKYTRWDFHRGDSTYYYIIPQYDNLGYLVAASGYRAVADTLMNKYALTHDGKGNFTRYENFNYKNQRTGFQECSLDEKGNTIEIKFFNKNDSLRFTMKNTFDEKNTIIRQETINENPKRTSTWDYKDLKLDDHGNWTESYADIDNGKYRIFAERIYVYY